MSVITSNAKVRADSVPLADIGMRERAVVRNSDDAATVAATAAGLRVARDSVHRSYRRLRRQVSAVLLVLTFVVFKGTNVLSTLTLHEINKILVCINLSIC